MVNENFGRGRTRVGSGADDAGRRPRPNPKAHLLSIGDFVKPNFPDARALRAHPPGVILELADGIALVRWKSGLTEQSIDVNLLRKVDL